MTSGAAVELGFGGDALPVGTPFHERTFALCQSLNYREWSGYYTVSVYEVHHEHEYNAIRNACALIDITPLRSEEHTSELQSQSNLVCRLLLEKKKPTQRTEYATP